MDNLIDALSEIYYTTNFMISYRGGNVVLLYDNEDLEWDDEFIDDVIDLAKIYLSDDELENFAFLFDYLDEIYYS